MAASLKERYIACMVLGAVGDSLGYKNGSWEFCKSGEKIHEQLRKLGGLTNITVLPPEWRASDDTVLHLATGRALKRFGNRNLGKELYRLLAEEYKMCMADMEGRSPGTTCIESCQRLDPWDPHGQGYRIPFNPRGGGCGAAIRSMCIGLRYPLTQLQELMEVSIESGRITHHHPTGYLGSFASALFVAYALEGTPVSYWGSGLLENLTKAKDYISSKPELYAQDNIQSWNDFGRRWYHYLKERQILRGETCPRFPEIYDVKTRDAYYRDLSYDGWGGSSGHDAPMIAYDAILSCHGNWSELCNRAMFHGGDSDSTGAIAGSLFGALYGFDSVPERNHKYVEFRGELTETGLEMYRLSRNRRTETLV